MLNKERNTRKEYQDTYRDANCEDCGEFRRVSCVAVVQKDLLLNPLVVHSIEDGHSNPEPNVEGGEHAAKVSTLLQAAHAWGQRHWCLSDFDVFISYLINLFYYNS